MSSCSNTTDTSVAQQVYEIAWLPDESGMLAYIDKTSISSLDGSSIDGQNLYHAGSDGTIGNSIKPADAAPNQTGYAPIVSVSPDGHTAITSFITNSSGTPDIYSVDLSSGNVTDIIQNTDLLGITPDQKFVETTPSAANNTAKLLVLYDRSANPIRLHLPEQTVAGAVSNRVLWIDDAHFAATIYDSTGADQTPWYHVTIFDTDGTVTQSIPNADVPLHASAYAAKSGDLFIRTHANGIDKIHLTTSARTSVLPDSVESIDVSGDGTLLVYSSGASTDFYMGYAVNLANGDKATIASSMIAPILSPNADRVAFIHQLSGGASSDIQVITVQTPP